MLNSIPVGLGEIKVSCDPEEVLVAYGLGSCLGIGVYDPMVKVAGLLHAILPNHLNPSKGDGQPGKYVDTGIPLLIDLLVRAGAVRRHLIVRMAGGANMLVAPGFSRVLNIGSRNIEAAQTVLSALDLRLVSHEVGGHIGRTVRFYTADGRMTIRTAGNQEREV